MKYLLVFGFCLSVYLLLRAFSFLVTYIHLYSCRETMCIERIAKQQKACDILNSAYQAFVMLVSIHFVIESILLIFNTNSIIMFNIVSIIAISLCYITYFVLRYKMGTKYHLGNFYNHMIDYRSKQKVVTRDNDNEVTFIRSYKEVMKHKRNINILYLVSLATLLYMYFIEQN